jgi:hypothetical protein
MMATMAGIVPQADQKPARAYIIAAVEGLDVRKGAA